MIALEIVAQLPEGLDELVETLGVVDALCLAIEVFK